MLRIVKRLWRLLFRWRETVVLFAYSPRQGAGRRDEQIRVFDPDAAIPAEVKAEFLRLRSRLLWWVLRFRMRVRRASLLWLSEEGRLAAYGWMHRCDPFLRRYRWLVPRGTLLGYFWTAPNARGRGLYGRVLAHCIAISPDRERLPLIVYADVTNESSIRGLEKAGFARLGTYQVTSRLFGLVCSHRALSQERTLADALAGR